jgi:hypothetical protein
MAFKIKNKSLLLIPIPALFLGINTMRYFDIPKSIWLINLVCTLLLICIGLIINNLEKFKNKNLIYFLIFLLTLTFFDKGFMDVHRWLSLGNFKLNIGLIITPILIIEVNKIQNSPLALFLSFIVLLIFLFQPDASQVTAFSLSILLILWERIKITTVRYFALLVSLSSIIFTWLFLDKLPPVEYVENILQMTNKMGVLYGVFSILSLMILPLPFLMKYPKDCKLVSYALGIYFTLLIVSTFFGNFPVMILGYGISPIIGYYVALIWLIGKEPPQYFTGKCNFKRKFSII